MAARLNLSRCDYTSHRNFGGGYERRIAMEDSIQNPAGNSRYMDLVNVACYAIEHGFDVEYIGQGNLMIRQKADPAPQ